MKRILLSALALTSVYFAKAQCTANVNTLGFYDDVSTDAELGNDALGTGGGLYWWDEPTLGGDDNVNFQATRSTRSSATGAEVYTVTQNYAEFVPFGIGFGDSNGDGSGTAYTIDLSGDATFSFTCKNNDPDSTIKIRIAIQDTDGDVIDTYSSADGVAWGDIWQHSIEWVVAPGATVTCSGDFTGGYYANYGPNTADQNVDFTAIKGVNFTVINNGQNVADNYNHWGFADVEIEIDNVKVGNCTATGLSLSESAVATTVAPNPTSGAAVVSYPAQSGDVTVSVSDLVGNEVATASGSATSTNIDASGLASGLYIVTVLVDGSPVSAQRLVVE